MQASGTPFNDPVDRSYFTHKAIGNSPRPGPTPSPSQFPAPEPKATRSRLPRTSSLLPPPRFVSPPNQTLAPSLQSGPSASALPNQIDNIGSTIDPAESPPTPVTTNTSVVNRWSTSTGSSRSNSIPRTAAPRLNRRTSSIDTTFLLTTSPPSSKRRSRKLQKSRRPSDYSDLASYTTTNSSPLAPRVDPRPVLALPTFGTLSSLAQDYSIALDHQQAAQKSSHSLSQSLADTDTTESPQCPLGTAISDMMPYDEQGQETYGSPGHARNRPGKGSSDSAKSRPHKPSQKATLSRALQKANTAVQLDNHQDIAGARQAYGEACDLLQQVLQRTSDQEDKRKLEAIQRTYTSRIEELDQMLSWRVGESKALPAFPDEEDYRRETVYRHEYEKEDYSSNIETTTAHTVIGENNHRPQPSATDTSPQSWRHDHRVQRGNLQDHSQPSLPLQPPEPGFLQSSFSRSPVRSRFPESPLQTPEDSDRTLAHVSLTAQHPPSTTYHGDNPDGPTPADFYASADYHDDSPEVLHLREESQNSWLDPIDESGGSTASSVHSRTSSMGYRRRHIRSRSGDTEAEFDTALDAAIEAAYDDGYEPVEAEDLRQVDSGEEIVANALRKVELARQRVRQAEREAYEMATEQERERFQLQPQRNYAKQQNMSLNTEDFFDDNSSEEEERMLEQMTRDYAVHDFQGRREQQNQSSVPRESDSSGFTSRTWQSSIGSNPPGTGTTSLSTVTESATVPSMPLVPPPAAPPPSQALPDIPPPPPPSSAKTVRSRRLSGQKHKQLKIETTKLSPPLPAEGGDLPRPESRPLVEEDDMAPVQDQIKDSVAHPPPSSPAPDASPVDTRPLSSPFGHRPPPEGEDNTGGRSASPSMSKLKKNFSSSSLRSLKSRNMSISHLEEGEDMSPGTPSSSQWGSSRAPAVPAMPTAVAANLRDKVETSIGGMHLLDDAFHSASTPGEPDQSFPNAPVPLEPCPTDFMLRPFWFMRCLYQTLVHPRGGYLSPKLFVPRDAWRVKGVKLKNVEDKIANCDFLTAALLKLSRVDTCDADAMLEEMQSMEGVLEQTQISLSRKLGNEVGVQSTSNLFKDASAGTDGDTSSSLPRTASVSNKASFSWRRLRSKNSAATLAPQGRGGATDPTKDTQGLTTLPMTTQPTSKPAKRDISQVQFTGPNANYMGSLARLFDAAQVIDQIARQVEDPGLRHADKTQVGLELCTRHAAEFFGFYICRFVLTDLGMLMDKFIKRGSEWALV